MTLQPIDITNPLREAADVCIIGSGCGGGAGAKILAGAGKRVVILEEGGLFTAKDFDATEETAYKNLYRDRAGLATDDLSVTILQGRCVGGSSTVNWTTSLRTPEFVLEAWQERHGLSGLGPKDLEPYFDRVEQYLNVHPEPDEFHSPNNRIILDGARALGYHAFASSRNTRDCVRAGACGLGCPFDAKLSVGMTYLPDAEKAGATILANCRAERIIAGNHRKRVEGHVLDPATQKPTTTFSIESPVVIVSASAIGTPALLLRSGLDMNPHVGKHLTLHLTTAVLGIFDRVIYAAGGIPQSAVCDEFLNKDGSGGGFWIEAVPVYPSLAAIALPSFGKDHRELMRQFPSIGGSIILVKETDSEGQVSVNGTHRPSISYQWGKRDLESLKRGIAEAARIQFAAGAREVMTLHAQRTVFRSSDEIEAVLSDADWASNDIARFSAHPLGTCRMGSDPRRSAVDQHGQLHGVSGLFVLDGSILPSSLGVNPQITILAVAEKHAEWIAENFSGLAP